MRKERSLKRMEEITLVDQRQYSMSRKHGGRGVRSVEKEYKNTNMKAAIKKLYCNGHPTMATVRSFEELAGQKGRHSTIQDVTTYAAELGFQLRLSYPNTTVIDGDKEVQVKQVKPVINKSRQQETQSTVSEERRQGKLIRNRWDDEEVDLEKCFAWLSS